MFRDLEQIQDSQKSRLPRQFRSDIRKADLVNGVHLDLALLHAVSGADFNAGTHPYPDAARNLSTPNSVAKPFGKHHAENLLRHRQRGVPVFASRKLSVAS